MGSSSSHQREPHVHESPQQQDIERSLSQDPGKIQDLTRLIAAETNRQNELATNSYNYRRDNMKLLKLMFGKMDPNVINAATRRDRGEMQLSLKYEEVRELLLVKVIRATNLDPMDLRAKSADPYVKLFLDTTPENTEDDNQTRIASNTLNPFYHEIFAFPLMIDQLLQRRLVAQVWDHDLLTPDDFIGEVIVNLEMCQLDRQPIQTAWHRLKPETNLNIQGDIDVSLAFHFPGKLVVTVHGATGLGSVNGRPEAFVKLQVPGVEAVYHTQVQQNTTDPVWEETFEFDVAKEEVNMRYVILHVVDYSSIGSNESLGQVFIELSNLDLGQGCRRTFALADLKNDDRMASEVSQRARMQEFREALVAHAAFRQPSMLFQKHPGKKVIKLTCRKAGSQARLRIMDSFPVH